MHDVALLLHAIPFQREYRGMLRRLPALLGICLVAVVGCGRTGLKRCANGVPCQDASVSTCSGASCDGGQPDVRPDGQPQVDVRPDGPTTCAGDLKACGATCTDLRTDSTNCGGCGNRCGPSQTCRNGACGCPAPGQTSCRDQCVLTATDPNDCGGCGRACGGGQSCISGSCACPAGTVVCGGVCRSLDSDPQNCGGCGKACPSSAGFCLAGSCVGGCIPPFSPCGGSCVDLTSNSASCGACGVVCGGGRSCALCEVRLSGRPGQLRRRVRVHRQRHVELRRVRGRLRHGFGVRAGRLYVPGAHHCVRRQVRRCQPATARTAAPAGARARAGQVCARGMCATTCAPATVTCGGALRQHAAGRGELRRVRGGVRRRPGCVSGGHLRVPAGAQRVLRRHLHRPAERPGELRRVRAHLRDAPDLRGRRVRRCAAGATACGAGRADTTSDPQNCGGCGKFCPAGQVCAMGVCLTICPGSTTSCGGGCVDLQRTPRTAAPAVAPACKASSAPSAAAAVLSEPACAAGDVSTSYGLTELWCVRADLRGRHELRGRAVRLPVGRDLLRRDLHVHRDRSPELRRLRHRVRRRPDLQRRPLWLPQRDQRVRQRLRRSHQRPPELRPLRKRLPVRRRLRERHLRLLERAHRLHRRVRGPAGGSEQLRHLRPRLRRDRAVRLGRLPVPPGHRLLRWRLRRSPDRSRQLRAVRARVRRQPGLQPPGLRGDLRRGPDGLRNPVRPAPQRRHQLRHLRTRLRRG